MPEHDPLDVKGVAKLREALRAQMQPCRVVLVVAGVHSTYSRWMREEIEMAKNGFNPPKAVIAIRPYGAERTSAHAVENADETIGWNTESIVAAIRRHS